MRRDPPSFQSLGQIYLNVSENTAGVHYVLRKVKDIFNDPSVELVTRYGLKIIDNEGFLRARPGERTPIWNRRACLSQILNYFNP